MQATFGGIEWGRPWGLLMLSLPVVLLLLSFARDRPEPVPVGTFSLWARLRDRATGTRRRRRLPLSRALLLLALVVGAVALGDPRRPEGSARRLWRIVVDPSPSMFLAHTDAGGRPTGDGTRLDRALRELDRWLAERDGPFELEWGSPRAVGVLRSRADELPAGWREPPPRALGVPRWERFDAAGSMWVTDREPELDPARAGVIASGGGPVPGPVGSVGEALLEWDGASVVARPGVVSPRCVRIEGELPGPVDDLVRAWAAERGLAPSGELGEALVVTAGGAGEPFEVRAGRDGWWTEGRALRAPVVVDRAALETWLAADRSDGGPGEPVPLVTFATGRVHVSLTECAEPVGDPAAFAVSWAELLDSATLPAPGVVSLAERRPAGPSIVRPPGEPAPELDPAEPSAWPLAAVLTTVALVLASLSLLFFGFGRHP